METQQGVGNKGISTFLSFGAKNVQPDILEKMLVGRQKTVNLLEQYAREIALNGVNHQVFIVGPRGAGKTHMLRVLYYRINDFVQRKDIVVSYFAEEEYGISGYLDFLIRIINAFMRWYDDERPVLETQLNILRETPESRQEYVAETIISDFVGDKPLLILSENFDTILEALGKDGQSKLRAWLYRHNRISIIATAQATSPDLGREDRPFYGFFSTISLKKLNYEESLELLRNLAEIEENQNMIEHLAGKGQSQVRAIHELIKGNHRLLVTFYEFLKANSLADLSAIFMKTMNDLKPYYETFIRFLPAQQQKILYYLALADIPQKGTDIAKNCFIATTSLTKQLSELQRQHLVDALIDHTDKRNKLYDISEPLLRIAIQIGEHREGIAALFIEFLARCYSNEEIKNQKFRFENMYLSEVEPLRKQKFQWEVEARDRALKVQEELEIEQKGSVANAQEQIELGLDYHNKGYYNQAIHAYQQAIRIKSDSEWAWTFLGIVFTYQKEYNQAIEAYKQAIQIKPSLEVAWDGLGGAYSSQGDYIQAVEAFKQAIHLKPNNEMAWYNLGVTYSEQNNYFNAMEAYEKATELKPDYVKAWYNLGVTYDLQNSYKDAVRVYQKATQLQPDYMKAWANLGVVYGKQGNHDKAIKALQKAIELGPNDAKIWYNLGVAYSNKGDYGRAIHSYKKTIEIDPTNSFAIANLEEVITKHLQTQTATESKLTELEDWLQTHSGFEIISTYVTTYRRVIFNNDEKALYELPKEQRIFFEREMLKRPI